MNFYKKNNFIIYFLLGLTLIATLKAYSIFVYTSRDIPFNIFPYNSFVWEQFHRFTDWLIANVMSTRNPYIAAPGLSLGQTYGFLTFVILRITNFIPEYLFGISRSSYYYHVTFFFIFILDLLLLYKIFLISLKKLGAFDQSAILLFFIIFVFLNYSIWFTIDRGNTDILALTFILFLYYLNLKNSYKYDWLILTLIACLKPSNSLLLLPIFFCRGKFIFFSLVIIIINYLLPLGVYHHLNISYLFRNIIEARQMISGMTSFCNNLACGLRVFGFGTSDLLILGISLFFINILFIALIFVGSKKIRLNITYGLLILNFLIFILIKFDHQIINYYYIYSALLLVGCLLIRFSNFFETIEVEHRFFFLNFSILTTFIINDPSPDYKLPYLIPAIFYLNNYFISNNPNSNSNTNWLVLLSFILIFSFINIPIPHLGPYYTILRILGILTLYSIMFYKIFFVNFLKKNYY